MKTEFCNIYLIDESLIHRLSDKMDANRARYFIKSSIDSVMYHALTDNIDQQNKPSFSTLEQTRYGIRNNKFMVFPIINSKGEISIIFEIKKMVEQHQERLKKEELKHDHSIDSMEIDSEKGDVLSSQTATKVSHATRIGFNILDEYLFKIYLEFIKKRVEVIYSAKEAQQK